MNDGTQLVQYEAMRAALYQCVVVDEAKDIRDKAAALAAYARQRDDTEMQVWVSEIHLRACQRIGQLSRELETAEVAGGRGGHADLRLPASGKSKADTLADAGLSTSTAHRYEELAGGRSEQGQRAAEAAAETYFARSRDEVQPATMEGLRGVIREALVETLGEPPERKGIVPFRSKPDPLSDALVDLGGAIRTIAELPEPDTGRLVAAVHPGLIEWHLDLGDRAVRRLGDFVIALRGRKQDAA